MNDRRYLGFVLIAFIWTQWGCTDFSASGCKRGEPTASGVQMFGLVTGVDQSTLSGLQCLSWEIGGEDLSIDLINFRGGCEEEWKGDDDVDGSTVTLEIEEDDGLIKSEAGCGSCLYDFFFQVDDLPTSGDVTVKIKMEGQGTETYTIADERRASGLVCKLTHSDFDGTCCGLFQYCSMDPALSSVCNEGLTCVPDESGGDLGACLTPCESDTECPEDPVPTICDDGLCLLAETF